MGLPVGPDRAGEQRVCWNQMEAESGVSACGGLEEGMFFRQGEAQLLAGSLVLL